jgi:hypothetical protein
MILPDDDPSRNFNPVTIDFPENREYTKKAKLAGIDSCYSLRDIAPIENNQSVTFPDSTVLIEAVTIKGQRKPLNAYADKKADQFRYAGTYTLFSKDISDVSTFEDILYRVGAFYVDKDKKKIVLRAIGRFGRGYVPALFVVDDVPIMDRTYIPIASMPTSQIASVTILRGHEGFGRYGNEAFGGVVFVTTKGWNRLNDGISVDNEEGQNDNPLKYIRLFRTEVEYYIPSKEEVNLIPEYQFRPTILWKENLSVDGSGPVKIKYPNNVIKGTVMIIVNGVSFNNLIGSNMYNYKVN